MHKAYRFKHPSSSQKINTKAIGFGNAWFATVPQEFGVTWEKIQVSVSKMAKFQHSGLSGLSFKKGWHLFKKKNWPCFHHQSCAQSSRTTYLHAFSEMPRQMHQTPKEVLKDGKVIHTVPHRIGDSTKRLDESRCFSGSYDPILYVDVRWTHI